MKGNSYQLKIIIPFSASLIGIATTISFLTAPVLAWLVHRAMVSDDIPEGQRIGRGLKLYSLLCIGLLTLFALGYLYLLVYF